MSDKTNIPTIEKMFDDYLMRVKLPKAIMPPNQYIQLKRAFFGGIASLLVLLKTELPELSEEESFAAMNKLDDECTLFWQKTLN